MSYYVNNLRLPVPPGHYGGRIVLTPSRWYWGQTKKWTDPAAMHVHFEKAQPKLDATALKKKQDDEAATKKTAATATAAATASQNATAQSQTTPLASTALQQAAAQQAQEMGTAPPPAAATSAQPVPTPTAAPVGAYGYPAAEYNSAAGAYGASMAPPAPGFMDRKSLHQARAQGYFPDLTSPRYDQCYCWACDADGNGGCNGRRIWWHAACASLLDTTRT